MRAESISLGSEQPSRTLVLTFDNLGEASELERGTWPHGAPLGRHPSVTVALPRLLDELDANALSATFFVEAINCELYPEALHEMIRRGHEIGIHGWRHESWSQLTSERELEALKRSLDAFATLGIEVTGFRPPGGELTKNSPRLLHENGISWCSPTGIDAGLREGLAWVPFDWELVDAYYLMEEFAPLRSRHGERRVPRAPAEVADLMWGRLQSTRELRTMILHPFLMVDDAWWHGVSELLAWIASLAEARVMPGGQFARWLIDGQSSGSGVFTAEK